jgi:hypothetical protein
MSKMKKTITIILVFMCATASLLFAFSPATQAQTSNPNVANYSLKVLSYSWYTSPTTGYLTVVGELQNNSTDIISVAKIFGTAYSTDGQAQATNAISTIFANEVEMLPNQTAPFYMQFTPEFSNWGNLTWVTSPGIQRIDFRYYLLKSNSTTATSYQDLRVMGANSYIDASGNYTITGIVWNSGDSYPEYAWVVASFYDSVGKVVAIGASNYIRYLAPEDSKQFTLIPLEPTAAMATTIASYNVQALAKGTMNAPIASPSTSPSASSTPSTSSSPNPTSSTSTQPSEEPDDNEESGLPMKYVYAIIAAVVIAVVVIVLALVVRGRKAKA